MKVLVTFKISKGFEAWLKMVDVALEAAVELDKHGIQAEVIDIRTLKPL